MKLIHSGLSTHESGSPAETVSLAILSLNFHWNLGSHTPGSLKKINGTCDLGVERLENSWPGLSCGLSFGGIIRSPNFRGREAERAEIKTTGKHIHVRGSDGGNILGKGGEFWEALGIDITSGHIAGVVETGLCGRLGEDTSSMLGPGFLQIAWDRSLNGWWESSLCNE